MSSSSCPERRSVRRYLLLAWLLLVLSGCASAPEDTDAAKDIYSRARGQMETGNYPRAIELLSELDSEFKYNKYAVQGRLELGFAYYRNGQPEEAIAAANRFIERHRDHNNVSYAFYIRGLAGLSQAEPVLERLMQEPPNDKELEVVRKAFGYLSDLASRYPKSRYFDDTMNQIVKLREKMAAYEIHAANYYLEHGSPAAAAKRAQYVIHYYRRTSLVADALLVLVKAHKERGDMGKARENLEALQRNYPEHPATAAAKKVLAPGKPGKPDKPG